MLAERIQPPDNYEKFSNNRIGDSGSWRGGVPLTPVGRLTTRYSDYSKCKDLVKMFVAAYNNCADNMILKSNDSGLKGTIDVDGVNSGADSFCSAVILILVAMKAKHIYAEAGSQDWECSWQSQADGTIDLKFQTDE